jgi:hypothetical protein
MLKAPIPVDDKARLDAFWQLQLLDTASESRFDRIIRTATRIFNDPISCFTLIDHNREWHKSVCEGSG